jgi:Iron dependent repressor, N-terminal DNA binding domain
MKHKSAYHFSHEKGYLMQHHLPNRTVNTDQHANFLNEHLTSTSRFHRLPEKVHPAAIDQLDERRERQVYLLTNGQRTIGQIAGLLGMHPVDVAHMMKRLLEQGYVEYVPLR